MGKSLRSKRMRANRIRKRVQNRPKELKKLKEALEFEYNEETKNAHLSMFNDIVNGPLPNDGTYFEPSITLLEKSQYRYENFLTRKIPKVHEIAQKNLKRPMEDPVKDNDEDKEEGDDDTVAESEMLSIPPDEEVELAGRECKPNKFGSWPKWMNQRSIRTHARNRQKHIKRMVRQEKRLGKSPKSGQNKSKTRNQKRRSRSSYSNQGEETMES